MNIKSLTRQEVVALVNHSKWETYTASYPDKPSLGTSPESKLLPPKVSNDIIHMVITSLSASHKHRQLLDMEQNTMLKWWGPQGGTPTADQLIEKLKPYYEVRPNYDDLPDMQRGIDYVTSFLSNNGYKKHSMHLRSPYEIIESFDKPSNSGILLWSRKNDPVVKYTTSWTLSQWDGVLYPSVLMHRFQRNKLRAVFNDEFVNYALMATFCDPLLEMTKKLPSFTRMKRGRFNFNQYIETKYTADHLFIECDAEAMDTTVTKHNTRKYVVPVLEYLFHPVYHEYINVFLEQMFMNDVWLPWNQVVSGEHSLFSGQAPTQLLEDLLQMVFISDAMSQIRSYDGKRWLIDDALIEVIGDDVIIILPPVYNKWATVLTPWGEFSWNELAAFMLERAGLVANVSKQRVGSRSFSFCKRVYSKSNTVVTNNAGVDICISARPVALTLLSASYPEKGAFTDLKQELTRIFQCLDENFGHTSFTTMCDHIRSYWKKTFPEIFKIAENDLIKELDFINSFNRYDFKKVITDEQFTLVDSPSYNYIMKGNIVVPGYLKSVS